VAASLLAPLAGRQP